MNDLTYTPTTRPSFNINDNKNAKLFEVLVTGNLASLSATDKLTFYNEVCLSLGLNPLTRPFEYVIIDGKQLLYAKKDCTDQLRSIYGVSLSIASRGDVEGVYCVVARATSRDGRTDEAIGAVSIEGLKGKARANALMIAESKAKRRVTLSICGLGMLDETEIDSIPGTTTPQVMPGYDPAIHPEVKSEITTFEQILIAYKNLTENFSNKDRLKFLVETYGSSDEIRLMSEEHQQHLLKSLLELIPSPQ